MTIEKKLRLEIRYRDDIKNLPLHLQFYAMAYGGRSVPSFITARAVVWILDYISFFTVLPLQLFDGKIH